MSKVVKNTFYYTLGNILPKAAGFILLPIYTEYLNPAEYGIVGSMEALRVFLLILFSLCIERGIIRLYWDYKTESEQKKFLSTVLLSISSVALIALLLSFIFKDSLDRTYTSISFYPYFGFTILTTFFSTFALLPNFYFRLKEKAGRYVLLSLLYFVLNSGFILWFIIAKNEGAAGYLKGQLYGAGIMVIVWVYISFRIVNFDFSFSILYKLLVFSLPFIPPMIVTWIGSQSNRIFIEKFFTLEDVGIFSFAFKIAGLISIFSASLLHAYEPVFFRLASEGENAKKKIFLYNHVFIISSIFIAFGIAFFSKEILVLFFNEQYHKAYIFIALILLAFIFGAATGITGLYFQQSKKMMANMYISLSIGALSLILNFLLIPKFGLYGATMVMLIVLPYTLLFSYYYTKKKCFFVPFSWKLIISFTAILVLLFIIFDIFFTDQNIYLILATKFIVMILVLGILISKYKSELLELIYSKKKSIL